MPDETSRNLWTGIRVWYPFMDPNGKWYRTVYSHTVKKDGKAVAYMVLVPESYGHHD